MTTLRRVWLLALATIGIALAGAPAASAERVFTVKGASAPGPAGYDRHKTYDYIDPLSAAPGQNAFLRTVIPFLRRVR